MLIERLDRLTAGHAGEDAQLALPCLPLSVAPAEIVADSLCGWPDKRVPMPGIFNCRGFVGLPVLVSLPKIRGQK